MTTGKCLHTLKGHLGTVHGITISSDGSLLVAATDEGQLWLWDLLPTPKLRKASKVIPTDNQRAEMLSVDLSSGGSKLVTICKTGPREFGPVMVDAFFWDVHKFELCAWLRYPNLRNPVALAADLPAANTLTPDEMAKLWTKLRDQNAATAYRGIRTFIAFPEKSLPLLKTELKPIVSIAAKDVERFIADLDKNDFAIREKACRDLESLEEMAEPALRKALAGKPSAEVKRQIRLILEANEKFKQPVPPPERLRLIRALEVLEDINNAEARKLVNTLADGEPNAWLTKEAKAVRDRLAKRPVSKP